MSVMERHRPRQRRVARPPDRRAVRPRSRAGGRARARRECIRRGRGQGPGPRPTRLVEPGQIVIAVLPVGVLDIVVAVSHRRRRQNSDGIAAQSFSSARRRRGNATSAAWRVRAHQPRAAEAHGPRFHRYSAGSTSATPQQRCRIRLPAGQRLFTIGSTSRSRSRSWSLAATTPNTFSSCASATPCAKT